MAQKLLRYLVLIMGVTTPASPVMSMPLVLYLRAMVVKSSLHLIGVWELLHFPMTILSNAHPQVAIIKGFRSFDLFHLFNNSLHTPDNVIQPLIIVFITPAK